MRTNNMNYKLQNKYDHSRKIISFFLGSLPPNSCLDVAYLGFGGLTTIIGISMIIYFIWVGILGTLLRKSKSRVFVERKK
jgi:hypothetical protein